MADEDITLLAVPVRLDYKVIANADLVRFLNGLKEGKILGRRCPESNRVYCPPREGSPTHACDMGEYVDISEHGTLTTFCVVNIEFEGQVMKVPYVYGAVLLDGSDTPFLHLINCPADEAHMGMRLKASWKPQAEREGSFTDIQYFEPSGQPDADYDSYKEFL